MTSPYVDERVSNTAPVEQTKPLIPFSGTPGPNDPAFQPSPANVTSDLA